MANTTSKARIHPTAEVSDQSQIGEGTSIWNQAQIREKTIIGKNCNIGKDVYIDAGVEIGNNVKIQNGVSVYHGVKIEDDVFLGPHMTFTNDMYPRATNKTWDVKTTLVKKGASIGANATIVCDTVLGEHCMVAAGSVVTRDVPAHGLVLGNPARLKGFVGKCGEPAKRTNNEPKNNTESGLITLRCKSGEEFEVPLKTYEMIR